MSSVLQQNYTLFLVIGAFLVIVLFAICVIRKFIRIAIGIAIMSIIVPILFSVFWGDGSFYISEIASNLTPNYQQQLEEAYAYYKQRDAEDQVVDFDAASDKVTDIFISIRDLKNKTRQESVDFIEEQAENG